MSGELGGRSWGKGMPTPGEIRGDYSIQGYVCAGGAFSPAMCAGMQMCGNHMLMPPEVCYWMKQMVLPASVQGHEEEPSFRACRVHPPPSGDNKL